jgi:hypothetical protein
MDMLDKEIIIVVVGFLGAIIAARISARAAIRAGHYQARAILEAARMNHSPRTSGQAPKWLELLLVVSLMLLLAIVVVMVIVTIGLVDVTQLLPSAERAISLLLF